MEEQLFKDKSPAERLQLLIDNCASRETQNVKVFFSEDDLAEMKSRLSEISITKDALEDDLKELSGDLRKKIKTEGAAIKGLLRYLKDKYEEQAQEVFNFDDQDAGLMLTYNKSGELLSTRKLRPDERQTSIRSLTQKAS
jgi:hypothetical protein